MNRAKALLIAAAFALLSVGTSVEPTFAQDTPELNRTYLRFARSTRSLHRMIECLVNQKLELARQMFELESGSPEQDRAMQAFFQNGGNCLFTVVSLKSDGLVAIGAAAERLIERDSPPGPMHVSDASLVDGGGSYDWTWRALTPEMGNRSVPVAFCMLARHGDKVAELLGTRLVTNEERKLFNAMQAEITACIPSGEHLTLQPQIFRAALALAYYTAARREAIG